MPSSTYHYLLVSENVTYPPPSFAAGANDSALLASNSTNYGPEVSPIRWGMLGLSVLIVATASGNILVCLAVTWEKRLQNMTNYFLMSLAIADLLVSLLVMPLAMVVEVFGRFPLGQSLCVIWATMDVLLCTASIWHMCIMSMDRYFTLRYPIRYGRNKTKKMMVLKITVVWLISFAVSVPLAIAGFVNYRNVYAAGKCHPSIKNFVLYGSVFAFYVPLIIMVVTYTLTIRILKQNRALMSLLNGHHRQEMLSTTVAAESLDAAATVEALGREGSQRHDPGGVAGAAASSQQSGYTITSAGLTSVKGSSTDSPVSPAVELRKFIGHNNVTTKRLPEILKINFADETNYLTCTLDAVLNQVGLDDRTTTNGAILTDDRSLSDRYSSTPDRRIPVSSSASSSSSLPVSRSQPICFSPPSEEDLVSDEDQQSSTRNVGGGGVPAYLSESNLPVAKGPPSRPIQPVASVGADRKSNATLRRLLEDEEIISDRISAVETRSLRQKSFESIVESRTRIEFENISYVYLSNGRETVLPIYQPSADTAGDGRSPFGTGGETSNCLFSLGLSSNGSAKRSPEVVETGSRDPDEAARFLASSQSDKGHRRFPGGRPNDNASPLNSEGHALARSRIEHYRRRGRKVPQSACARKIGVLMSKSRSTSEEKASKVLGIIFAVFVLSWTPFFTMNIVSVLCERCMALVTPSMMTLMVWLGYLSSLANPIIYTMFSISFRTVFYRILTCQYRHTAGCGPRSRSPSHQRYLCWSKNGRDNCLQEFRSEYKFGGL